MLEIKNLHKKYGRVTALNDFSLSLDRGICGLLGPNGSGKTTLLRMITGLIEPSSGSIKVTAKVISAQSPLKLSIGYLPQRFGVLKELTVYQQMRYFASFKPISAQNQNGMIVQAINSVGLEKLLKTKCGKLSGGMVRRLGIAQAILGDPDILLFDEPTAGLDPEERLRFKTILNSFKSRCPVILSTHIVEDVESVSDHVVILHEGQKRADTTLDYLISQARGRVFEADLTHVESLAIPHVVSRYAGNSEKDKKVRIILTNPEGADALEPEFLKTLQPCNPTVEDSYLLIIKREADRAE